jgi:hypothetical protein
MNHIPLPPEIRTAAIHSHVTAADANSLQLTTGANAGIGIQLTHYGLITAVTMYLKKQNTPTGTATVKIYKDDLTTVLSSVGTLDVSTLTTSYVARVFTLTPPVIASGVIYVALECAIAGVGANVIWGGEQAGDWAVPPSKTYDKNPGWGAQPKGLSYVVTAG